MDPNHPNQAGQPFNPDNNYPQQQPTQPPQAPNRQFPNPSGPLPPPNNPVMQPLPVNPTSPISPMQDDGSEDGSSKKKIFIIIGAAVGALALFAISLLIGFSMGKGSVVPSDENSQISQEAGPRPATAIDIEQANNSISQDLSSINDDRDFPEDALSDEALGL